MRTKLESVGSSLRRSLGGLTKMNSKLKLVVVIGLVLVSAGSVAALKSHSISASEKKAAKQPKGSKQTAHSPLNNSPAKSSKSATNNPGKTPPRVSAHSSTEALKQRVDRALSQKRINSDQAKQVLAKYDEMVKFNNDLASKSKLDQYKARSDKQRALYTWAKENKIPFSLVVLMGHVRG